MVGNREHEKAVIYKNSHGNRHCQMLAYKPHLIREHTCLNALMSRAKPRHKLFTAVRLRYLYQGGGLYRRTWTPFLNRHVINTWGITKTH